MEKNFPIQFLTCHVTDNINIILYSNVKNINIILYSNIIRIPYGADMSLPPFPGNRDLLRAVGYPSVPLPLTLPQVSSKKKVLNPSSILFTDRLPTEKVLDPSQLILLLISIHSLRNLPATPTPLHPSLFCKQFLKRFKSY